MSARKGHDDFWKTSRNIDFNLGGSYMEVNMSKFVLLCVIPQRQKRICPIDIHFKLNLLEQMSDQSLSFFHRVLHPIMPCASETCFVCMWYPHISIY